MSNQSLTPFADRAIGFSFLRKRRTIFALAASLITLYLILRSFALSRPSLPVDDLHGLLYMVSRTDDLLPQDLDVNSPVHPSTWFPREVFDQNRWQKRIERLDVESPVIVFSKSYCPYSQRAKDLLTRYALKPAPHIVEVDLRDDSDVIKRVLYRLTGRATFPNIILQGRTLGGYDNLHELHVEGNLENELERAGVAVTGNIHDE